MKHFFVAILLITNGLNAVFAQQTFPIAAPSDPRDGATAYTNATIYRTFNERLEGATLVIRKGRVEICGIGVAVPKDAAVVNCEGRTIYPAFIDLYANYGLQEPKAESTTPDRKPQTLSNKKGAFAWNESLKSEFNAAEFFRMDTKTGDEFRKIGFGALLSHRMDGIARGTGTFVQLGGFEREHELILTEKAANFLSFRKGTSTQGYPSSLMGCIALLRQTYLDADWYKNVGFKTEKNHSIEAWNDAQNIPQIFEATEKYDILRIAKIGKEFSKNFIVKTRGDEYQRIDEIKASGQPLIVPLNFPDAFDIEDPFNALAIELKDLKNWELAPTNAGRLEKAGIPFAITTAGLKEKTAFLGNLRKAMESGLSEEGALKALTFTPANLINNYGTVGSLEAGKMANFIIANTNLASKDFKIFQSISGGKALIINELNKQDLRGNYVMTVGRESFSLFVTGTSDEPKMELMRADSSKIKVKSIFSNGTISMSFVQDTTKKEVTTLSGTIEEKDWSGRGTMPDGTWTNWRANFLKKMDEKPTKPTKQNPIEIPVLGDVVFPWNAFGWTKKPTAQTVLVKNTTIWTNEKEGVLTNTDVLISGGKITKIGKNLPQNDQIIQIIDGSGKFLTAGILDEHSHIAATRSINEGTQESSAEVRVGDVIDSDDIDIYRQLAGGVTSVHVLHGSANPIGGQTQLIKLRWGASPEAMKMENWDGFIKFALGENVKQANWGDDNTTRYPQTRMGVEQVYEDYFQRAKEYGTRQKLGKTERKDLEMDCLLEILEKKRFITCHSYVQSEITMLMRLAERFNFKVQTFTHILEGYKVADKMAKHGVGASSFSDWWDYKWEVYDAIPRNAEILHDAGVTVAINSDDAEMARRLNQEAAKSVMYGNVSEEEAWKFVTLNPAKLMRVDSKIGSIKVGKDADIVLWSDNPLSIYAKAEKTFVDGILYFDRVEDAKMQIAVQAERARLIQKMLKAKQGGAAGGETPSAPKKHYHCDSDMDEG
jgi:imidazolonepropionase-like amidohydrolase